MRMDTSETYFDRAWNDLVADEGWWKAVFALGLVNCVPIIGQIVMFGYLFDWAKEAAWGMTAPLSRQLGDLGRRIKYGFMALWVMIIWVAPVLVVAWLISFIPIVGGILSFIVEVLAICVAAISAAAALRSLVYEHVMPGLQVKRVLRMVRKDPGGLAQSFCIILLLLPLLLAALFIVLLPAIPFINLIASTTISSALGTDLALLIFLGMLTLVVSLVVWIAGAIVSALIAALYVRSLGYWMEQFDPAQWKTPTTPMPFELEQDAEKAEKRARKKAQKRRGKKKDAEGDDEDETAPKDSAQTAQDASEQGPEQ